MRSNEAESGNWTLTHQPALVLSGDKARGNAGEAEARQADQADIDQQHDDAEAEAPSHGLSVGPRRAVEDPVEAPKEVAQYPVHRPDHELPEHTPGDCAGEEEEDVDTPRHQRVFQAAGRHFAALVSGRKS